MDRQDLFRQNVAADILDGLPNRRHDQLLVVGKQQHERGLGRRETKTRSATTLEFLDIRSTKPAATNSLSCSVIAVRVTPVSSINSPTVRAGQPTSSLTTRIPAAVTLSSAMIATIRKKSGKEPFCGNFSARP